MFGVQCAGELLNEVKIFFDLDREVLWSVNWFRREEEGKKDEMIIFKDSTLASLQDTKPLKEQIAQSR